MSTPVVTSNAATSSAALAQPTPANAAQSNTNATVNNSSTDSIQTPSTSSQSTTYFGSVTKFVGKISMFITNFFRRICYCIYKTPAQTNTSEQGSNTGPTQTADLSNILAQHKATIRENPNHYNKLLALRSITERTETEQVVSDSIKDGYNLLPADLKNAIAYRVHELLTNANEANTDGNARIQNNPTDGFVKQAIAQVCEMHPSFVLVQNQAVAQNTEKTWQERGQALLNIVQIDRDPSINNTLHIARHDDLPEATLKNTVLSIFREDMRDIELDFCIHVRHKLWELGGCNLSGEELVSTDPLSVNFATALREVLLNGYRTSTNS